MHALTNAFDRDIPLLRLFEHTSIGTLAAYLDQGSLNQPADGTVQNRAMARKAARQRRTGMQTTTQGADI